MTSYVPVLKNGASGAILYTSLAPQSADGTFKANPTLASGDVKISLDGGSFANLTTLPAVTPASGKAVKITLSQAETNADNIVILFSDAAGAEWCDQLIQIATTAYQFDTLPNANADALLDRADAVESGLTVRGAWRLALSTTAGKLSGAGTGTETFRNAVADSKDRVTATVDSSGNRTAITYDAS